MQSWSPSIGAGCHVATRQNSTKKNFLNLDKTKFSTLVNSLGLEGIRCRVPQQINPRNKITRYVYSLTQAPKFVPFSVSLIFSAIYATTSCLIHAVPMPTIRHYRRRHYHCHVTISSPSLSWLPGRVLIAVLAAVGTGVLSFPPPPTPPWSSTSIPSPRGSIDLTGIHLLGFGRERKTPAL